MENNQVIPNIIALAPVSETSQELRMLSRALSECQSLNVMIRVSQFVKNSQLCNYVTKALKRSLCLCLFLCHFMTQSLTRSQY